MNDQEGIPVSVLFLLFELGIVTNRLWYPGCSVTGVTKIVSDKLTEYKKTQSRFTCSKEMELPGFG